MSGLYQLSAQLVFHGYFSCRHSAVDFDLMRRQTLTFSDFVLTLDRMPQSLIAGRVTGYRMETITLPA